MVPVQALTFEQDIGHDGKNTQAYTLLNDLELYKAERSAVALKADAVGGHLTTVLEESDAPRQGYHADERPMGCHARLLQTQMAVPRQGHEDIAENEEKYGVSSVHVVIF